MAITNNDIMRRVRYIFDFSDSKMIAIFASSGHPATRAQISDWMKKDSDPAFEPCDDPTLAAFLNGVINEKRGKRDGVETEIEQQLTNNIILRKLKIALNLTAEDILDILELAGQSISKHELSAFFRGPAHKHYRVCQDQVLRKFLQGLQQQYRPDVDSPWSKS